MLWHQSGVNPKGEPFVQLIVDDKVIGQMTPDEARDHARAITEAAEAAETDAFIFDWVQKEVGVGPVQAAGLLGEFRRWRETRTGKKGPPSDPAEFVMPPDRPKP